MRTDAQKKADYKSRSKIYEQIVIQSRKDFVLNDRIKDAALSVNMSKNAFLLYAIEKELNELGYPKPETEARIED